MGHDVAGWTPSQGWVAGFCRRWEISSQCRSSKKKTSIQERLPQIQAFHQYWLHVVQRQTPYTHPKYGKYAPSLMYTMDQVPMPFATPHLRTLNEKGTQLPVRLVGVSENDKRFCTLQVTLCAQADQQDVKLEVIFRSRSGGANIDKTEQAFYKNHPEIKVRWQHKAWADEEVIFDYLMDFREQTMDKGEVVLFMDNHGSQRTPLVQLTMEALDIKPIFFPANCTDCVSPVDRNIGAWLKRKVYMYQEEELEDHEYWSFTVCGRRGPDCP